MISSPRLAAILATCAAAFLLSPAIAHADTDARELVVLVDGDVLTGTLIELVPGDHVTLVLTSGEVRRIDWTDVASATTSPVSDAKVTLRARVHALGGDDAPAQPAPTTGACTITPAPTPPALPPESTSDDATSETPWLQGSTLFDGGEASIGFATGIGTPTGFLGAQLAVDPTPWLELEGGVGLGGSFGRAISGMARLELPVGHVMRFGLGLGLSENFLSDQDRAAGAKYAGAPAKAEFLNLELSQDYAMGKSSFLRFTTGWAILQNGSDYASMCTSELSSQCDPTPSLDSFYSPATAGRNAANHSSTWLPYFGIEALWQI